MRLVYPALKCCYKTTTLTATYFTDHNYWRYNITASYDKVGNKTPGANLHDFTCSNERICRNNPILNIYKITERQLNISNELGS